MSGVITSPTLAQRNINRTLLVIGKLQDSRIVTSPHLLRGSSIR